MVKDMQVAEVVFLDREELAGRWGMSPRTLEAWGRENPPRGPVGRRFGKRVQYRLEDVEAYEQAVFTEPQPRKRGRPGKPSRAAAVSGRSGRRAAKSPFGESA